MNVLKKFPRRALAVCVLSFAALAAAPRAQAQVFGLGAHVGAVGTSDTSKIGYGAHLTVNPFGWGAFWVDATFANFGSGVNYFSTNPTVILYAYDAEDLKLGVLGGAGFHHFTGADTHFALHAGAMGEFGLSENLAVGLQARNSFVFGDNADNIWAVLLTLTARFEKGGW